MNLFVSLQHILQLKSVYIDLYTFNACRLEVDFKRPYGDSCGTELTLAQTIGLDLFEDENGEKHLSLAQYNQMKQMHADLVHLFEIVTQHIQPGQLSDEHASIIREAKWVERDGRITMCNDLDEDMMLEPIRMAFEALVNQADINTGWWHRDEHGQWRHTKEISDDEAPDIFGEMRAALSQKQINRQFVHTLLNTHTEGLNDYALDVLITRVNTQ